MKCKLCKHYKAIGMWEQPICTITGFPVQPNCEPCVSYATLIGDNKPRYIVHFELSKK